MNIKIKADWLGLILVMAFGVALVIGYWVEKEEETLYPNPHELLDAPLEGLKFEQINEHLYAMTGTVRQGDCEKIVPKMPKRFAVILESPGGNLAEGMCLASHMKLRDVVTVVRSTPMINEEGKVIYEPGLVDVNSKPKGTVVCASSCSLLFLGGDQRYLIGDVWFGIHGPSTPEEILPKIHKRSLEQSAYRTAVMLQDLLIKLGVKDPAVRRGFLAIPSTTMYWLNPRDFERNPGLVELATHYRGFWGLTLTKVGVE